MRTFTLVFALVVASGCNFLPDLLDRGGSEEVRIHLVPSSIVLPVPPYGSFDIRGATGTATFRQTGTTVQSSVRVEGLKPHHPYRLFVLASDTSWEETRARIMLGDTLARFGPWERGPSFLTNERGEGTAKFALHESTVSGSGLTYVSAWVNDDIVEGTLLLSRSVHTDELR